MSETVTEIEWARIDSLDAQADAIESCLYGKGAQTLPRWKREAMKAQLSDIYDRMGKSANRLASAVRARNSK